MPNEFTGGRTKKVVPPIWLYDSRREDFNVAPIETLVLPENPFRVAFVMGAPRTADVIVWPMISGAIPYGYDLGANGGFFEMKWSDHPAILCTAWYAICPSGLSTLRVIEEFAVR